MEIIFTVPTKDSIQVLASLSVNLYQLLAAIINISEDSDDEEMEVSSEQVCLQDYIHLLNHADRVKRIILYVDEHGSNEEVLMAIIQMCHNLLLTCKDAIRKFM